VPALKVAAVAAERIDISEWIAIQTQPGGHVPELVAERTGKGHHPLLKSASVAGMGVGLAEDIAIQA
jgi:hypothetical protein